MLEWTQDFLATSPAAATPRQLLAAAVVVVVFGCLLWIGTRTRS